MKIETFKKKFLELPKENKLKTIEMFDKEKDSKINYDDIPVSERGKAKKEFFKLIDWCKANV